MYGKLLGAVKSAYDRRLNQLGVEREGQTRSALLPQKQSASVSYLAGRVKDLEVVPCFWLDFCLLVVAA